MAPWVLLRRPSKSPVTRPSDRHRKPDPGRAGGSLHCLGRNEEHNENPWLLGTAWVLNFGELLLSLNWS